jgi:cyclopropane fatty-acyl-phospholipid synthase-like methyltransferase
LNRFEYFATIERYHTFQNPTSEEKLDLAASYCSIRDGMRVLDVGCGKGWLMRRLAKRFHIRITGLEINPILAAEARSLAAAKASLSESRSSKDPRWSFIRRRRASMP